MNRARTLWLWIVVNAVAALVLGYALALAHAPVIEATFTGWLFAVAIGSLGSGIWRVLARWGRR